MRWTCNAEVSFYCAGSIFFRPHNLRGLEPRSFILKPNCHHRVRSREGSWYIVQFGNRLNLSVVLYENPSLVHLGDCSRLKQEITYCWRVSRGGNRNKSRPRCSQCAEVFYSEKFHDPKLLYSSESATHDRSELPAVEFWVVGRAWSDTSFG